MTKLAYLLGGEQSKFPPKESDVKPAPPKLEKNAALFSEKVEKPRYTAPLRRT